MITIIIIFAPSNYRALTKYLANMILIITVAGYYSFYRTSDTSTVMWSRWDTTSTTTFLTSWIWILSGMFVSIIVLKVLDQITLEDCHYKRTFFNVYSILKVHFVILRCLWHSSVNMDKINMYFWISSWSLGCVYWVLYFLLYLTVA